MYLMAVYVTVQIVKVNLENKHEKLTTCKYLTANLLPKISRIYTVIT